MRLRKRRLEESRLYALIDKDIIKGPILATARKIAESGAGIIQLRDKHSSRSELLNSALSLNKLLKKTNALFIVNDYPEIARISGSDGLHIGQFDLPVKEARRIIGKDKLIGVSCSNLKQALKAERQGADYIAIGPVFTTRLKPKTAAVGLSTLKVLKKKIKIPVFAIGGVSRQNLAKVLSTGISRVAVCRAILRARDISGATRYFSTKLK